MGRIKKLLGLAGTAYSGLKKALGFSAAATTTVAGAAIADEALTGGKYIVEPLSGGIEEGGKRVGAGVARTENYTNWLASLGNGLLSGQAIKGWLAGMVDLLVSLNIIQKGGDWDKWAQDIKSQAHQTGASADTPADNGPVGGSPDLGPTAAVGLGAAAVGLGAAARTVDPTAAMKSLKTTAAGISAPAAGGWLSKLRNLPIVGKYLGIAAAGTTIAGAVLTANSDEAGAATPSGTGPDGERAAQVNSAMVEGTATTASIAVPMAVTRLGAPALAAAFPTAAGTFANVPVLGGIVGLGIVGEGAYSSVKGYMDGSKTGKEALLNAFGAAAEGLGTVGGFLTYGLGASVREGVRAAGGEGVDKSLARQGIESVSSWLKSQFTDATDDNQAVGVAPVLTLPGRGFSFVPM